MQIKRALISVSNKQGVVDFARKLHEAGVEIVSTGGTMKAIKEAGIPVTYVSDVTGFPEIMDGRVKTLNPYIHGGILAVRDNPEHVREMEEHHITGIDLVAVNLYPFKETIAKPNVTLAEAIENIDIGGPAMVRAAAKNFKFVTIVTNPARYDAIAEQVTKNGCVDDRTHGARTGSLRAHGRLRHDDQGLSRRAAQEIRIRAFPRRHFSRAGGRGPFAFYWRK